MADSPRAKRLYLHVGLPKSGTTYLQARMAANRSQLRHAGILYPAPEQGSMFHAALEIRGSHATKGFSAARVAGSWARLTRLVQAHPVTTVLSHEHLSGATPEEIAAAAERLHGVEVHVVVTARDPVRQIPAMWQESVKNGDTRSFEQFSRRIIEDLESGDYGRRFWSVQELGDVVRRWGTLVPPERIHVVTAPPGGQDPGELWRRFGDAVGFDPDAMDAEARRSNTSLGIEQVALLRDVNLTLDGRIRRPAYDRVVKRLFAQHLLAGQQPATRPVLPAELFDLLRALAERWVDELDKEGVQVHGSLQDLLPAEAGRTDARHPDDVSAAERYDAARDALAELLVEVGRLQRKAGSRGQKLASGRLGRTVPPSIVRRLRRLAGRRG